MTVNEHVPVAPNMWWRRHFAFLPRICTSCRREFWWEHYHRHYKYAIIPGNFGPIPIGMRCRGCDGRD